MADSTGVQVFVGPANRLEVGDVITGPPGVTIETVSDRLQRIHFSIPSPTQELVDTTLQAAADAAAAAAPTDAQLTAILEQRLAASNIGLDVDGRPYFGSGLKDAYVIADTDGRPYFVS